MTLAALRKNAGLTQLALAQDTGVSQSTIASYELGERKPSPDVAERIRSYFNLTIEEMWRVLYGGGEEAQTAQLDKKRR